MECQSPFLEAQFWIVDISAAQESLSPSQLNASGMNFEYVYVEATREVAHNTYAHHGMSRLEFTKKAM